MLVHIPTHCIFTYKSRWTVAGKSIHLILTGSAVLTGIIIALVDIRLATSTCTENSTLTSYDKLRVKTTILGVNYCKKVKHICTCELVNFVLSQTNAIVHCIFVNTVSHMW